jgi:CRISPR-associated protein Cas1
MSAQPIPFPSELRPKALVPRSEVPDYLSARMANEFVYCPRLFFYEWVDGLFRESADRMRRRFMRGR